MQTKTKDALRRADMIVVSAIAFTVLMGGACTAYAPYTDQAGTSVAPSAPAIARSVSLPTASQIVAANASTDNASADSAQAAPSPTPTEAEIEGLKILAKTECLADAMYYEARGEGEAGELAIAEVVYNRMHRSGYPHSICGVVFEGSQHSGCQFSFTCNGEMLRPKTPGAWRQAQRLALRIVTGNLSLGDTTGGALSFHATDVQPDWSDMERTTQIGNHVFYRRVRHSATQGA
jgi:spore germination cell wall hydrolase CwlJ-like protein